MKFRESEEAFHRAAVDACPTLGCDDFGVDDYREGLRALLASLDEDATLNEMGEMAFAGMIVGALRSRLYSEHGFRQHPEAADAEIERPLVIIGLPRTGTTALHHLIYQDPSLQGLELWLAGTPKPRPPRRAWGDDADFRECEARMAMTYERSPEMKAIHLMQADLPDECWNLLAQTFSHSSYEANADVSSYSRWWAEHDMRPAYRRHRRNLQLIGHREPDKRWLLKDATHLFDLGAFLDVYSDAMVVQTHRDPVKLIGSVCSLCWSARKPMTGGADPEGFGRSTLALWRRAIFGTMEVRKTRDPSQFYDLPFERFTADPLAAIRDIYAHFGLAYSAAADTAITRFRAENPPGKHGEHTYSLEQWGLDADEIRAGFQPYVEAFDVHPST